MRALALVLGLLLGPSSPGVVCTLQDPAITEASGLVDLGRLLVVANDSGNPPVLQVVDPRTGRTVGHTRYAPGQTDVEALAPAGPGHVWVGDIGDNRSVRPTVTVRRVAVGRGDRTDLGTSYTLRYPDGPHDAETLLRWRGRLLIVTKALAGGGIYEAPFPLRSGVLRRVGSVPTWATDGAVYPGTSLALVRSYARVLAVRLPEGRVVGSMDLPAQRQGEDLSIGPHGRIRVTSEGLHQQVLQVTAPGWLRAAVRWSPVVDAAWAGAILVP